MITQQQIDQAVRILAETAQPVQIILFGSYARGEATEDSDLDLLVIEREVASPRQEMMRLRHALADLRIPVDLLVFNADYYDKWSEATSTTLYWAKREGKVIYDATGIAGVPPTSGGADCKRKLSSSIITTTENVEPNQQHEVNRKNAARLMRHASDDETLLDAVLTDKRISDEIIGLHLQQAAENLLKAILAYKGIVYRRTHDLNELMESIRNHGVEIPGSLEALKGFTHFAIDNPDSEWRQSDEELDRHAARELLRQLRVWAESLISKYPIRRIL